VGWIPAAELRARGIWAIDFVADLVELFVKSLEAFAIFLERISPVPWPLGIAILFPLFMACLDVAVWLLRGTALPVRCDYPVTTRGHPCQNQVLGE
jgi:hypothetical protein